MARLKARYNDELKAKLQEELSIKNVMEIPRITKITLNMGVGAAATDKKLLDGAVADMQLIAGQKPVVTLARNLSLVSKSVMVGQLVVKLLYVATKCTNSWTV